MPLDFSRESRDLAKRRVRRSTVGLTIGAVVSGCKAHWFAENWSCQRAHLQKVVATTEGAKLCDSSVLFKRIEDEIRGCIAVTDLL